MKGRVYPPAEARFWACVEKKDSGCWEWTGVLVRGKYGQICVKGRHRMYAHRFSYQLHFGPIPGHDSYHGYCVCHRCDNPKCVNPDHLFLGTNFDNIQDRNRKGRTQRGYGFRQLGTANPVAKLTDSEVLAIFKSRSRGVDLATQYGVSQTTITQIRQGKTWAHLTRNAKEIMR